GWCGRSLEIHEPRHPSAGHDTHPGLFRDTMTERTGYLPPLGVPRHCQSPHAAPDTGDGAGTPSANRTGDLCEVPEPEPVHAYPSASVTRFPAATREVILTLARSLATGTTLARRRRRSRGQRGPGTAD